jgi:regulator of protease activity HflC (stomatin/prohibitin superfamily)
VSTSAPVKVYTGILERPLPAPGANRRKQVAGGVLLPWLLTSIFIVRTDQQAVVTRFGAVVDPRVMPGIHIAMPWPVDRVTKLKVQQLQRLVVGG